MSMFNIDRIPPNVLALLGTLLGILLNLETDADEQNSIGNFLISIGQAMVTASAQAATIKSHPTKSGMQQQLDQMSAEIDALRKQLKGR